MEDLNPAIHLARQRVAAVPEDQQERHATLNNVAMQLAQQASTANAIDELEEAIRMFHEAASTTPPGRPELATYLSNLGHALGFRYEATQDMLHLEETIHVLRQALSVTKPGATTWPVVTNNLGMRLGQRHERTHLQAMQDLDEAVKMSRVAVSATPPDDSDRVRRLHNLGNSLNKRYMLSKNQLDLDGAIECLREAVNISPPGTRRRAQWFTNLGNSMSERYALTRDDEHLEESIQMLRKGLQASSDDLPPATRAVWLNNLGLRLADRYTRRGDLADLVEAIEIARQSLDFTAEDDPERINRRINLANRLCNKFQRTGAMDDLDQGIAIFERAVSETPSDSPERANFLSNLGESQATRYLRTNIRADLEKAIDTLRQAVDASQFGKPGRGASLSNLGNNLAHLYGIDGSQSVLDDALKVSQQAVDATPAGHPAMAERVANISLRLRDKFLRTKEKSDIDKAVRLSQEAVDAAPPNHPVLAACFDTAGILLLSRHREYNRAEDLANAKEYLLKALHVPNAAFSVRVRAGRRLLSLPGFADDPRAFDAARSSVDLIPLLASRSLQDTDKRHLLADAVGMASDAAAIALQAGQGADAAIRCLEIGRGVIAGASFEQRDVSSLMREHRDLAISFTDLRDRLDKPAMQDAGSSIRPEAEDLVPAVLADTERRHRREAQEKLEMVLAKIRSLKGFEKFLLPPSPDEMSVAAKDGPIAILNVSSHRCDALLIETHRRRSIQLLDVTQDNIKRRADRLGSVDTLEWLWDKIVSPVLGDLGLTTAGVECDSYSQWPRIWWIPTGHLTKFPLHAAGYHLQQNNNTTLDRVISSYSASLRAIIHSRRSQHHSSKSSQDSSTDLVVVSMEKTIGHKQLYHADREVKEILSAMDSSELHPKRPRKYKQDVLSALKDCKIFHFAGHGSTHPTDPLQSMLLLKDWEQDPLTVESLLQTDLGAKPPFLAYLSACGTGQIQDDKAMDESIHLANAFQLVGVRHVVGTLWSVQDALCVQIARRLYDFIRCNGLGDESVSRGLHSAIRVHRDSWLDENRRRVRGDETSKVPKAAREAFMEEGRPRSPYWVPYVHFGI